MATDRDDFHVWLFELFKSLNLDEEVLGDYIAGILDSDDSNEEEKLQAVQDTLEGMMDTPDVDISSNILTKWRECEEEKAKKKNQAQKPDILAAVMEKQAKTRRDESKKGSDVDVDIKKHVIAQYGQQSDDDDDVHSSSDEEFCPASKPQNLEKGKGVFQNTNSTSVAEKEKAKREKQKTDNEEKKLKIKQDREKQKEKVEQRKDKEKKRTQKGERRR